MPLKALDGGEFHGHVLRDNWASGVVFVDPGSGDVLALDIAHTPGGRFGVGAFPARGGMIRRFTGFTR